MVVAVGPILVLLLGAIPPSFYTFTDLTNRGTGSTCPGTVGVDRICRKSERAICGIYLCITVVVESIADFARTDFTGSDILESQGSIRIFEAQVDEKQALLVFKTLVPWDLHLFAGVLKLGEGFVFVVDEVEG